ncbi:MAG: hypothetical protein F9B45_09750 [Phycisphaera sp. RhM]|nr:hypothetical protein [Phycisphaera sp. RhM]
MGKLLKDLGRIGPEGKAASEALKSSFQNDGKFGNVGLDKIIGDIRKIDPEAADAAQAVVKEMQEADRDAEFRQTLRSLEALGDEGRQAASVIEAELLDAEQQAAAGMDQVLAKLQELRPEANLSADAIEQKMREAAEASQREFDQMVDKLREAGPAGRRVADEMEREMRAAGDKSEDSIEGIIDKIRDINPEAAKAARKIHSDIDRSAKDSEKSFSDFAKSAVGNVLAIAGAYVSVQSAIRTVIELQRKAKETDKDSFSSLKTVEEGNRRLLQVATDAEDFKALKSRSDDLASNFGLDRTQSRGLVFDARSGGFEDSLPFIARNAQVLIDAEAQSKVAAKLPKLFQKDGLSPEQAINATLAGSQASTLSFEQLSEVAPVAAEGTALAGSNLPETLAALAVTSERFGSQFTAADRLKGFGAKVALDPELAGKGIIGATRALMNFTEERRKEFLGQSSELNGAYGILQETVDKIDEQRRIIESAQSATGTDESPVAKRIAAGLNDPEFKTTLEARKAEIGLEIEREQRRAIDEGGRQSELNKALRVAESTGIDKRKIAGGEIAADLATLVGVEDSAGVVDLVAGEQLTNLSAGLRTSLFGGDSRKSAAQAVNELRRQRRDGKDLLVSPGATAGFLSDTTGSEVAPESVTSIQQQVLTQAILAEAKEAPTTVRRSSALLSGKVGGLFQAPSSDIADRFAEGMLKALERNNELMEQQLEAAQATADNTSQGTPEPIDYGSIQRGREG